MAEGSSDRPARTGDARAERLKRALRDNLKRRKAQARQPPAAPGPPADENPREDC